MPKQAYEFNVVGGEYKSVSSTVNNQECVNFYVNIDKENGKPLSLLPTPGCKEWLSVDGNAGEVRALSQITDELLAFVIRDTIYITNSSKVITTITPALSTTSGQIIISSDFLNYCTILDKTINRLYVLNLLTFTITLVALPIGVQASSLTYQDSIWIISNKDSDYFYMSEIGDPYTYTALRYKSAEYSGDKIIAIVSDYEELCIFGSKTIEFFQNTGNTDTVFESIHGSSQEVGLAGADAFTSVNSSLFFLDSQGFPRVSTEYRANFLNQGQIAFQMSKLNTINDCFLFNYVYQGHVFVVFTFPTENKTWVYDVTTGIWHRRSSYPYGTDGRWRANCYAFFNRKHLIGDYDNGKIYELDFETFTENSEAMAALRRCPVISFNGRTAITHNSLEFNIQSGVGIETGQGNDPQIMMRYSDDNGRTFSNELWESLGKIGEFSHRVIWNRLGRAVEREYEIKITDPINRVITGGFLNGKY